MRDAVIIGAVRTPVGKRNGSYAGVHPADMSAHVLRALAERTGVDPATVDDVVWGCVSQVGAQLINVGPQRGPRRRLARVHPRRHHRPAMRLVPAGGALRGSAGDVGTGRRRRGRRRGSDVAWSRSGRMPPATSASPTGRCSPSATRTRFNQGIGAEMIAEKWGLSRAQLDEFSLSSHEKAAAAIDSGAFAGQYVQIQGTGLAVDEGVRRETTLEKLGSLRPAFKEGGVITRATRRRFLTGPGHCSSRLGEGRRAWPAATRAAA